MFAPKVRRSGQSLPCVRQRSGGAVLNDSPVGCQTRAVTEPQRDGGICEANDGEVFKTATFKPLSRARKERAPGIPRGMMRGKAHKPRQLPQRGSQAAATGLRADEGIGPYK